MDHPDLRPGLEKLVRGPASTKTKGTKPHGTKVLEAGEDTTWVDEDTGEQISMRTIPAALDQLRADLEAGVSTAGNWNTVSTSAPPSSSTKGYPEGAYWTLISMATGDPVEKERWVVRGGAWEPIGLDASQIVTGKVNAGLIDTVALLSLIHI